MAEEEQILGKKINELDAVAELNQETLLPALYVKDGTASDTAGKVNLGNIRTFVQQGVSYSPNVITDLVSTDIQLNILSENTIYQYGTLNSLTIGNFTVSYNETVIYFTSGTTPTVLTFANEPIWINGAPEIEASKNYVISISNGFAIYGND